MFSNSVSHVHPDAVDLFQTIQQIKHISLLICDVHDACTAHERNSRHLYAIVEDMCEHGIPVVIVAHYTSKFWRHPDIRDSLRCTDSITGHPFETNVGSTGLKVASTSAAFLRLADTWTDQDLDDAIREDMQHRLPYIAYPAEMHIEGESTLDGINDPEDETRYFGPETDGQQERDYLDELDLRGFPEQEAARRRAWLSIPREARAAIRRLHTMLGRAPQEVM
jgi:hypothetical protein